MGSKAKLSVDDRRQILKWANPGRRELQLLYSFTKDGANATTFHTKCNNKGPTVTVIYNTEGSVYGGYTTQHWDASGTYKVDEMAFLFSLRLSDKRTYVKFPVENATQAIYCSGTYGPTFGGGHDLRTFNDNLAVQGTAYTLNGSVKFGTSYDMLNIKDITNNIMTVTDLEVYGFRGIDMESIPWRRSPELTKEYLDSLKDEIEQFVPSTKYSVSRSNILLVGQIGAGKSSFINSVDSIFRGQLTHRAICGIAENSVTLKYRTYPIHSGADDKPLKFRLCDTRGLEVSHGIKPQDLMHLVDGYVQDGHLFNPFVPLIPATLDGIDNKPSIDDQIHCVCFVIDGSTVDVIPDKVVDKIKTLQSVIRQKDIPHVVLLTKVDRIVPFIEEDLSSIFESETIEGLVQMVGNLLGVQRNHVLPMKNYESETDLTDEVSALTLINLKKMLMVSADYISEHCQKMSHDSVDSKVM